MPPLVRAAAVAAVLLAIGALTAHEPRRVVVPSVATPTPAAAGGPPAGASAPCPRGTLPDHGVCIPAPPPRPASS